MGDLLGSVYFYVKAFHVMAVLSWMAGLFYLPRLFVYHVERAGTGPEPVASLRIMEGKLLRLIMNPAMVATWVAGLALVFTPGIVDWSTLWPWTKAAAVLAMTWFHHWLAREYRAMRDGPPRRSGRSYRLMNEVPTLLMIIIVASVIIRF